MADLKPRHKLLGQLESFSHDYCSRLLDSYTRYLRSAAKLPTANKEVNDAQWGTVKLRPLEVLVLDSPLLQRLRFVKQLGVVHWVYPGATHARFEHTLGVLYQAQQIITAVNEASGAGAGPPPIDSNKAGLVRLCALLHDIGHGVFSHVSEHALRKVPAMRLALNDFAEERDLAGVQLSELMAYYMIGSPSFRAMLAEALDRLGQPISFAFGAKQNADRVADLVQSAIIGEKIDEEVPLLHEIITGPFDADKLDYYVRDARLAGIPPILDISRLTQKITVRRLAPRDLPPQIAATLTNTLDAHYLFGLKWSGASILDELHLARVLLYSKIYRHKKVQAVESMIDALFDALGTAEDVDLSRLVEICYNFSDDQLLWSSPKAILAAAEIFKAPSSLERFVGDVLKRLRERSLYVAALAIRATYPSDPWGSEKSQKRGLNDLVTDVSNAQRVLGVRDRLISEIDGLLTALPGSLPGLDPELVRFSVAISSKAPLAGGTEIDRAFIFQGSKPVPYRDLDGVNHSGWASAYDFASPAAIVFCPRELAAVVYVAAERLFRRQYNVILPTSALEISKQDAEDVLKLKRGLEQVGWYDGVPLDIRAVPERLTRQDADVRIEAIANNLKAFDEPRALAGDRRAPELKDRIRNWLAQFREDGLISAAMEVLEKMRFLDRGDTHDALTAFLDANPEFEGATVCPLGELKDSGAVQAYISRDLERRLPRTGTVEEAVERSWEAPILFLDDFTASGSQALDILGHWFGDGTLQQSQLGEERLPFGEREREFLRSRPIGFVFVAGWDEGMRRVREAVTKLELDAKVYVHIPERDLPFAFSGGSQSKDIGRFKERCVVVGRQLLQSAGKDSEKQADRALGYGNRAMLLGSRLNIPTQTLTCIWMDGRVDGVDWHALLRRREKH